MDWLKMSGTNTPTTPISTSTSTSAPTLVWSTSVPPSLVSCLDWLCCELIALYVSSNAHILEINCGTGRIFPQIAAQCKQYYGVDPNPKYVQEAQQGAKLFSFPSSISAVDVCRHSLRDRIRAPIMVDTVLCMGDAHRLFADKKNMLTALHNVANLLKTDGVFAGWTLDSNVIWNRSQKKDALKIHPSKKCASVTSPYYLADLVNKEHPKQPFQAYGTTVHLRFPSESSTPTSTSSPSLVHPLIHFPTLVRVARRVGLECIELENLSDMIQTYRNVGVEDEAALPTMQSAAVQEQAGLYLMFSFRRVRTASSHQDSDHSSI